MGNGHPVSAVITSKEIEQKFAKFGMEFFSTFGGGNVAMAVSEAVIDTIQKENLQ